MMRLAVFLCAVFIMACGDDVPVPSTTDVDSDAVDSGSHDPAELDADDSSTSADSTDARDDQADDSTESSDGADIDDSGSEDAADAQDAADADDSGEEEPDVADQDASDASDQADTLDSSDAGEDAAADVADQADGDASDLDEDNVFVNGGVFNNYTGTAQGDGSGYLFVFLSTAPFDSGLGLAPPLETVVYVHEAGQLGDGDWGSGANYQFSLALEAGTELYFTAVFDRPDLEGGYSFPESMTLGDEDLAGSLQDSDVVSMGNSFFSSRFLEVCPKVGEPPLHTSCHIGE